MSVIYTSKRDEPHREVLREIIRDVQARNADVDPRDIERLVDEELDTIRRDFRTKLLR